MAPKMCYTSVLLLNYVQLTRKLQSVISFAEEELVGVPNDVIAGYKKRTEGSKEVYDVTYKMLDTTPIVSCLIKLFPYLSVDHLFYSSNSPKFRKRVVELRKGAILDCQSPSQP